ncbi:MAG: ion transporter [Gemmatimonadetes bacterium]|nr:ion transporter [Gemmatimonadota bacterium]NNM04493.1 ion transporter [Gemmatimonadota bacterium]
MRVRRRVWEILEIAQTGDGKSRAFDLAIRGLIALNVLSVILETVPEVEATAGSWLRWFDIFSVAVFSVEYVLRVWSSVEGPARHGPISGRVRFALTPLLLIDLLAVLPFFLPMTGVDLRILRGVRLFRLFRILKLARYSEALRTLGRVFARRRTELALTLAMVGFLLLLASALMFFAEHGAQPERFPSIPAAMWWGIVTLTTLGYGDVYPITIVGRMLGGVFALVAILLIAMPTAILGSSFMEEMEQGKKAEKAVGGTCPHCGGPLGG